MQGQRGSEVALLLLIAGFAIWLAQDAARRSFSFENLVLMVPVAGLILLLCGILAVAALRRAPQEAGGGLARVLGLLALLGGLVAGLETIGFDAAAFLFLLAATALLGERRPLVLLAYAGIMTFVIIMTLGFMLPYEMPTLLLDPPR